MILFRKGEKSRINASAICLGIYFMAMPFDSFRVFGIGSLTKVIMLLPIIAVLMERNRYLYFGKLTKTLIVYAVYSAFSLIYSVDYNASSTSVKALLMNVIAILCVSALRREYDVKEVTFLKTALVIGGLGTILLTFLFPTTGTSGRLSLGIGGGTQDQNYINGYIVFAFTMFVIRIFTKKALYAIPAFGIIVFVLFTGSRGALLAYFCIAIVVISYIMLARGKKIQRIILMVLLILFVYGSLDYLSALLPQSIALRFSRDYVVNHANTGRVELWRYFLTCYKESSFLRQLFGYGFGASGSLNHMGGTFEGLRAHNLFIDHLVMGGIIGVILFIFMIYCYLRAAFRAKDLFLIGSYIGYIVMMMTLSLLSYKPIWNCMMMIIIISRQKETASKNELDLESDIGRELSNNPTALDFRE